MRKLLAQVLSLSEFACLAQFLPTSAHFSRRKGSEITSALSLQHAQPPPDLESRQSEPLKWSPGLPPNLFQRRFSRRAGTWRCSLRARLLRRVHETIVIDIRLEPRRN